MPAAVNDDPGNLRRELALAGWAAPVLGSHSRNRRRRAAYITAVKRGLGKQAVINMQLPHCANQRYRINVIPQ